MADPQFIERSVVQVNGIDLDDLILSVAEKSSRPTKAVNTMNKGRVAKGFKQGNNQYSLEIDAERIVDARVPDWHALKDAGTIIKIQIRYNIGKPVTYAGCKITDVADTTSDGDSNRKISVMARTRKEG
jgi:hypothetical protein